MKDSNEYRIFIQNVHARNNGLVIGEWIDLPTNSDELKKKIAEIVNRYPGGEGTICIGDYDLPWEVEWLDNIFDLNDAIEEFDNLAEFDQKIIFAIKESTGYDIEECLEIFNDGDYQFWDKMRLIDVAEQLVQDGFYGDVPYEILQFIDYNAVAKDLETNGFVETEYGVIHVC